MKDNAVKNLATPDIRRVRKLSLVWLVPVLALLLASYLVYQQFLDRGLSITIRFPQAEGLVAGKTELRYQGFKVGVVSHLSFSPQENEFTAHIDAMRDLEPLLKEDTQFWLVKPQASLLGVSGLDTLFSGNYIAMQPGQGRDRRHFVARRSAPAAPVPDGAFMVELALEDLGSLGVGSPIYYRHVPVGQVHSFHLDKAAGAVVLKLVFDEDYRDLVKRSSRFRNASGLKAEASLSGIKVETHGLVPLLSGGLIMESPEDAPQADYGQRFVLSKDKRFRQQLHLRTSQILPPGTPVVEQQRLVGEVLKSNDSGVTIGFVQKAPSRFYAWVAERQLKDLSLETLLHPRYVRILPGVEGRDELHQHPPLPGPDDREQLIELVSDKRIADGVPLYYKGFTIGEVLYSELVAQTPVSQLLVYGDFRQLVTRDSRIETQTPLKLEAKLSGIKVDSAPIADWWQGALKLIQGQGEPAKYGQRFHVDEPVAPAGPVLRLLARPARALPHGTPLRWQGFDVGQVESARLLPGGEESELLVRLDERHNGLIDDGLRFYWQPPLKIQASLKGLDLTLPDLASLQAGTINAVRARSGTPVKDGATFRLYVGQEQALSDGQRLQLSLPLDRTVVPGTAIKHLGLPIGEVASVRQEGKRLLASLQLVPGLYPRLARDGSRFTLITPEIGLGGVKHLDALLSPYLAVMPGEGEHRSHFALADSLYDHDIVYVQAQVAGDLGPGSPVWFRDLPVGEILAVTLTPGADAVHFKLAIKAEYGHLVRTSSIFWRQSGFKARFGLLEGLDVEVGSLQSLIKGGIQFGTRPGGKAPLPQRPFPLRDSAPDHWQHWPALAD
ncbi:MlaD family protein [Gallaecimonas sp. GXIMD4217]|uniref:MlaD family protein n=1 Tax=Gallaecimonas sp. GXIMD4217 TaxID=3131927 RepID=UPI00311AEDDC